jgi:hypothetical protein
VFVLWCLILCVITWTLLCLSGTRIKISTKMYNDLCAYVWLLGHKVLNYCHTYRLEGLKLNTCLILIYMYTNIKLEIKLHVGNRFLFFNTTWIDWFIYPIVKLFTARYGLDVSIKLFTLRFIGLMGTVRVSSI